MIKKEANIKKLENSMLEIEASITVGELNKYREGAVKKLGAEIKTDGFRQGHIPENILIEKIGEMALLNEMAEMALADIYPALIMQNEIKALGHPQITITKLAPNNPVEFKAVVAVLPEITLPDYKKLAQKINNEKKEKIEITEKEVEDTITQIQKMNTEQNTPVKDAEGKISEPTLPEINDEFVKKLGDFKDVADFKIKLKENIRTEKERKAEEIKRVKIMDTILENTKMELPEIIAKNEAGRMLAQTKADIAKMGLQFDKYLEHIKKTEEELRKEMTPEAEKRAKIQLILDMIIKTENIKPDENEVKKNIEQILQQHNKTANSANKQIKENDIRPYVEMVLSNQEVFKLLEKEV
ncbi:MAG: trigger factor [Patescibacteria group bacterium]